MGSTRWSDEDYADRKLFRASTSTPTFAYHADIASGKTATAAHKSLDPKNVKIRECRDSDTHPKSRGVAVLLDVTGSMSVVPKIVQESLPKLMGLIMRKGYLQDPAILIGAIGDAVADTVPLQMGQFESGIEIENDLTNLYLEGGGGGSCEESYELGMYFLLQKAEMDCLTKRGEKGYLFIIGDERPYPSADKKRVKDILGDDIEVSMRVEDLVEKLKEKFHIYFILPKMTNHFNDVSVRDRWKMLIGQNLLLLEEPSGICELIASTIGVAEGIIDSDGIEADLKEAGTDLAVIGAVSRAAATVKRGERALVGSVASSGASSGVAVL